MRYRSIQLPATTLVLLSLIASSAGATECNGGSFPSTFALIQKVIFENHDCTNSLCHSSAAIGGLNLLPEVAYDNLVDVPATTVPGWTRVSTGQKDHSLMWLNLAAKTLPDEYHAPLRPMPLDPLPALSWEELELVRRWIEAGASRDGIVLDTADLVDACLPPPKPIEITPLPPPPPGQGVQLHMPRWELPPNSENEVCIGSYYDVTDQVPLELRQANGTFRYKSYQMRQDPLSHHMILSRYNGDAPVTAEEWGEFRCRGGLLDDAPCDPLDLSYCGEGSGCATDPARGFACVGFGPPAVMGGSGFGGGILATQESAATLRFADGVYSEIPMKGVLKWNSHGFNLTDSPGKLEAWVNLEFAPPEEQITPALPIFNTSKLFAMNVTAFSTQEICAINTLPPNAHLYELSSHTHKHGKRFRTFAGAWRCDGGPNHRDPCSPFGPDFNSPDLCAGAPCVATARQPDGDCNQDGTVTVDEVITGVSIVLGVVPMSDCRDADGNDDDEVSIDELIVSVNAAIGNPPPRTSLDSDQSLLYVNLTYNDPVQLRFDPPRIYPPTGSSIDDRALTYCSLYDNGFTNPDEVKRKSTSPPAPPPGLGGPCSMPTHCTSGQVGQQCSGRGDAARDASCDSGAGTGDGVCDACPLSGGETTEDEMCILIGSFYVP